MIIMCYIDVLVLRIVMNDEANYYNVIIAFCGCLILSITVLREEMSHLQVSPPLWSLIFS